MFDESPTTTTYHFSGFDDRRDVIFVASHAVTNTSVADFRRESFGSRLATFVVLDKLRRNNDFGLGGKGRSRRRDRPRKPGWGRPCGNDRLCGRDRPSTRGTGMRDRACRSDGRSDGEMSFSRARNSWLDSWQQNVF